jgi:hypothetical protein
MRPLSKLFALAVFVVATSGCTVVSVNEEPIASTADQKNELLRKAVLEQKKRLLACYDYELKKDKNVGTGKVLMEWDVDDVGHAQNIRMDENASTLKIPTLTKCLSDEIREIDFPIAPNKGTNLHIRFPFAFNPEGQK